MLMVYGSILQFCSQVGCPRCTQVNKLDWLVWMAAFCGTLFISIEIGLGISIGLAVMIVVYESAFPHTALLGRVGSTGVYRNVKQYPDAMVMPGIMVARFDSPL